MNENQVNKKCGQKPVAWDTAFKWYSSMSTFCSMPQICMHHLLPVSLPACLPACPGLAKTVAVAVAVRMHDSCLAQSGTLCTFAVLSGNIRHQLQRLPNASGPICGFLAWLACCNVFLVANWIHAAPLALSHRSHSTRFNSDNCLLCASLTVAGLPQTSSLACNRFTFESCRTHKDYTPNERTTIASIRYLLDYQDL